MGGGRVLKMETFTRPTTLKLCKVVYSVLFNSSWHAYPVGSQCIFYQMWYSTRDQTPAIFILLGYTADTCTLRRLRIGCTLRFQFWA
jgi:hypothetical protein